MAAIIFSPLFLNTVDYTGEAEKGSDAKVVAN